MYSNTAMLGIFLVQCSPLSIIHYNIWTKHNAKLSWSSNDEWQCMIKNINIHDAQPIGMLTLHVPQVFLLYFSSKYSWFICIDVIPSTILRVSCYTHAATFNPVRASSLTASDIILEYFSCLL